MPNSHFTELWPAIVCSLLCMRRANCNAHCLFQICPPQVTGFWFQQEQQLSHLGDAVCTLLVEYSLVLATPWQLWHVSFFLSFSTSVPALFFHKDSSKHANLASAVSAQCGHIPQNVANPTVGKPNLGYKKTWNCSPTGSLHIYSSTLPLFRSASLFQKRAPSF